MTKDKPLIVKKPRILRIVCLIAFFYYGIISVVFFMAFLLSTGIIENFKTYIDHYGFGQTEFMLTTLATFIFHGLAFTGVAYMWKMRRRGFIIFLVFNALIIFLQLFQGIVNWIFIVFCLIFIILFGSLLNQFKNWRIRTGRSLST